MLKTDFDYFNYDNGDDRLDTYKKVGDSLAGRFFQFRLHPLDLKEIYAFLKPDDLENARQITQIETLIQLLKHRVGSPISYSSLAQDLQCSDKTVKKWLTILENMYVLFSVPPFHQNIAKAIQKSPKFYFYDTGQVLGDPGVKLENAVACAIQKELHFREDCLGEEGKLYYLKDKDSSVLFPIYSSFIGATRFLHS